MIDDVGGVTAVLVSANPDDKLNIYREPGLRLTYLPDAETVRADSVRAQISTHAYAQIQYRYLALFQSHSSRGPVREKSTRTGPHFLGLGNCADHMRTELVTDALNAAQRTRGGLAGAIFHSDH